MKLLIEIPDDDNDWIIETADEQHRFAGEPVLSYLPDDAPPDIKIVGPVHAKAGAGMSEIPAAAVEAADEAVTELIKRFPVSSDGRYTGTVLWGATTRELAEAALAAAAPLIRQATADEIATEIMAVADRRHWSLRSPMYRLLCDTAEIARHVGRSDTEGGHRGTCLGSLQERGQ